MTTCLQQQTEWIAGLVSWMRANGKSVVEPTAAFEEEWVRHHDETANATLISRTNSWYVGSNIEGKPRRVLSYTGGVGTHRAKCEELAATGYPGLATN